jgi:isochorismate synthase
MVEFFQKVTIHQEKQLPFAVFCKPNSERIVGLFQNNDQLYFINDFTETGFVFAPFSGNQIPYIPQNDSEIYVSKLNASDFYLTNLTELPIDEKAKADFESLVKNGVEAIQSGSFEKVVLSRKEEVVVPDFDLEMVFKKLVANYPSAFKYVFFHPTIGLWMGAIPEQFLKVNNNEIQTVALAGTQVYAGNEKVVWGEKEKKEQQFVTDFIADSLKEFAAEVVVSETYTTRAGNLLHIKSDIKAKLSETENIKDCIAALHPTPAVCGLPKKKAQDFIFQNEGYDRAYYSGFLGELNVDLATFKTGHSDLFVNLRCMKIKKNTAEIYVGCGITSDSNPEMEFTETVNKSMTMKKVIL